MRILALDWGLVRIGGAVSDPEGKISFPLDRVIESKNAVEEIKKIVEELQVEQILIGNPKSLSGSDSQSSNKVFEFVAQLEKEIGKSIEMIDERFSTVGATKVLNEQGLNQRQQREIKDNISAQLILQNYLDTKVNN